MHEYCSQYVHGLRADMCACGSMHALGEQLVLPTLLLAFAVNLQRVLQQHPRLLLKGQNELKQDSLQVRPGSSHEGLEKARLRRASYAPHAAWKPRGPLVCLLAQPCYSTYTPCLPLWANKLMSCT